MGEAGKGSLIECQPQTQLYVNQDAPPSDDRKYGSASTREPFSDLCPVYVHRKSCPACLHGIDV